MIRDGLKRILKKANVPNSRVSKELGIDQGQLSRFFHGKKGGLSLENVERIIRHFGYDVVFVQGKADSVPAISLKGMEEEAAANKIQKEVRKLLDLFEDEFDRTIQSVDVSPTKAALVYPEKKQTPAPPAHLRRRNPRG